MFKIASRITENKKSTSENTNRRNIHIKPFIGSHLKLLKTCITGCLMHCDFLHCPFGHCFLSSCAASYIIQFIKKMEGGGIIS
jgi:hypothetical protein